MSRRCISSHSCNHFLHAVSLERHASALCRWQQIRTPARGTRANRVWNEDGKLPRHVCVERLKPADANKDLHKFANEEFVPACNLQPYGVLIKRVDSVAGFVPRLVVGLRPRFGEALPTLWRRKFSKSHYQETAKKLNRIESFQSKVNRIKSTSLKRECCYFASTTHSAHSAPFLFSLIHTKGECFEAFCNPSLFGRLLRFEASKAV